MVSEKIVQLTQSEFMNKTLQYTDNDGYLLDKLIAISLV